MSAQPLLVAGTFLVLLALEQRWPLRRTIEPKGRRLARNLAVAGLSAVAVRAIEMPLVLSIAGLVERRGWGILQLVALPSWLLLPLALVLMDYTLYVWHVLTHRVPFLWRFHVIHHLDLDLDASTALRFHCAELLISVSWRAAQLVVIGVGPAAFVAWQTALLLSTMFHHSNVRLPEALERRLVRLVVTPRMHGIHHDAVRTHTDSNWSSGLTLWDRLHGTLRLDVALESVVIGVPAHPRPVGLGRLLALPFGRQPDSWVAPQGSARRG
jgi:sterol desaturase/sphingolipid hydroxylase (fatty acid hydroxylase superfamily)